MAAYEEYLTNDYTGEVVLIKSNDYYTFNSKINKKREIWKKDQDRREALEHKNNQAEYVKLMTSLALAEIEAYKKILHTTLKIDDKISWENLEDKKPFRSHKPLSKPESYKFFKGVPQKSIFEFFIPFAKKKRLTAEANAQSRFKEACAKWEYDENVAITQYNKDKAQYVNEQQTFNDALINKRKSYESYETDGIENYINLVLERSKYPDTLSLSSEIHFDSVSKVMIIDLDLPNINQVPKIVEYKYSASKDEVSTKTMKDRDLETFYNDTLYQICLRTIHEVFESDYINAVEAVVFNGWVDGRDSKTGKAFRNCILSVLANKKQFFELDLNHIFPEDCFRYLKGKNAGSLANLAPIQPIMKINKEDGRIVEADNVLNVIDPNSNLATMPWEQFEVLVRDLFEKEFSSETCTVKVTRQSRDAGVDAIVFDEDPIRGGKYVIQAKRYNNLVPLSAVRDLFGTVHNEGAVKGILVTTSYFGPDAIEFIKDKPLTLINGNELIYMFNKHGYNLNIQLQKKQSVYF